MCLFVGKPLGGRASGGLRVVGVTGVWVFAPPTLYQSMLDGGRELFLADT